MIYRFANCELNTALYELRRDEEPVSLEPQVFDLLLHLVEHSDRVVTKSELYEEIWQGRIVSEAALSSRVKAARQAIGDNGRDQHLVRTVRGRGFRFVGSVTVSQDGIEKHPPAATREGVFRRRLAAILAADPVGNGQAMSEDEAGTLSALSRLHKDFIEPLIARDKRTSSVIRPQTQFTKCGDVTIAYQVSGAGPIDLVYVPGWLSNIEYEWENPRYTHLFQLLGSFARLIRFDKRGTGMSDRELGYPTLEQRMDDVRAVMEAAGSERAAILCMSEGGMLGALFAATYPERTVALVLLGCFARGTWAPGYPFKPRREDFDAWLDDLEREWGGPFDLSEGAPSVAHEEWARQWFAAYLRFGASPHSAIEFTRSMLDADVRGILPSVRVPTLVLQRLGDRWAPPGNGRYLAEHIPDATLVELPGEDHLIWAGDYERIVAETQEFLTGMRAGPTPERTLLTVLMTDIVSSTATAAKLGDHSWRHLLEQHDTIVRGQVKVHGGREVKAMGDGFLLTFDGPTAAIACANSTHIKLKPLGLKIRAGLHTGECEKLGEDLSGIAVHITSRILDRAQPDSTWVSSTVKDIVVGSGIEFTEEGTESLKGVPGTWTLFSVSS